MLKKKTLLAAKTENLKRLAKWMKIDISGLNHRALAEQIYFKILFD